VFHLLHPEMLSPYYSVMARYYVLVW